jgi:hypothetical protein
MASLLKDQLDNCMAKYKNKLTDGCYQVAQKQSAALGKVIEQTSLKQKSTNRARQEKKKKKTAVP